MKYHFDPAEPKRLRRPKATEKKTDYQDKSRFIELSPGIFGLTKGHFSGMLSVMRY